MGELLPFSNEISQLVPLEISRATLQLFVWFTSLYLLPLVVFICYALYHEAHEHRGEILVLRRAACLLTCGWWQAAPRVYEPAVSTVTTNFEQAAPSVADSIDGAHELYEYSVAWSDFYIPSIPCDDCS